MEALSQSGRLPAWQGGIAQYALDQCAEAALLADAESGFIHYANSAARALLGYHAEELLERRLEELLPELPRLLAQGGGRNETVVQHRDGQRLAVELVLSQPLVEGRRFQFAFIREISERKRLEDQLREARKMEVVGRLVAGVSHDFNNLLTAILIYTGLLLNQLPTESPLRRQAEQVNVAAERGRSLVSQLMALGGRRSFEPTLLSLNEVVESVRDMLSRLLGEHISLETSYGERLAAVWADRTRMEQMLVNLAVNGRDAMPDGGLLRIATANFTAGEGAARKYPGMTPGQYVRLTVSDTGCGMDEETRAHALEPFFTTKPLGQGTGLGLSTVSEIVRQSRGHLILESALGRGTQVQVFLPGVEAEVETAATPRQEAQTSGAGTVLVVEDEELVRRSLHEILAGKGYRVLQARNAREAMLIGRGYGGPIDLMLTDLVLPGMGGPELADELRPARPDMRVLYISGYRNDARVRRLEQAGKAFFPKPFTAAAIAEKVSEVLAAIPGSRPDAP
jgi:PAS domain S-box-containing protein